MAKKRLVLALGHDALGTNLPEQKAAVAKAAKTIADFIQNGWQVAITHGNTPQLGMIHTALNELAREHKEYTPAPMSVCSAMSQGYIGYDLQNALRTELIKRGIYKPVSTILTQVTVDPYDESSYTPLKVVGRTMTAEEAKAEEEKGNFTVKTENGYRRIVAAPRPVAIVEIDAIKALLDADHLRDARPPYRPRGRRRNPCYGAGIQPEGRQRHHRKRPGCRTPGKGNRRRRFNVPDRR
ncbi:carbamate kinase [Clostridium sp. CAG:58]|nr:carbamate kinase [Clostridium sp. CAG:58]